MAANKDNIHAIDKLINYYHADNNYVEAIKYYEQLLSLGGTIDRKCIVECYVKLNEYDKALQFALKTNNRNELYKQLCRCDKVEYLIKYIGKFMSYHKKELFKYIDSGNPACPFNIYYNKYMKHDPDEADRLDKNAMFKLLSQGKLFSMTIFYFYIKNSTLFI